MLTGASVGKCWSLALLRNVENSLDRGYVVSPTRARCPSSLLKIFQKAPCGIPHGGAGILPFSRSGNFSERCHPHAGAGTNQHTEPSGKFPEGSNGYPPRGRGKKRRKSGKRLHKATGKLVWGNSPNQRSGAGAARSGDCQPWCKTKLGNSQFGNKATRSIKLLGAKPNG